ncbi:MAG: hypothetical protein JNM54_08345 [Candidatus Accumulibacter sp.]|jgi:hypothetical protein|uniref:hypothetical protein n=1 Tax=unclassified Candidatus Accumulibacter TaxID=2619054 RepID=UPI001A536A62|nr:MULTISPECIES: hypothetical protein [unclassified Candidatus Accumulibacter]MBL8367913.1 hypothetical protein [Accumulibacter sp.]
MQLTLVVPELVWPEPDDRETFDALACPGLNTLIARSRLQRRAPQSFEATLGDAFGLAGNVPWAAFRVLGEKQAPTPSGADPCWLCADPVHLRLHQEKLILADAGSLDISSDEAHEITAELNRQFADIGTFHVASADRWYLQLAGETDLGHFDVPPLSVVAGRRLARQLPATPQARHLRQLLNEVQMVLYGQPANERREAAGRATINSLWLWGAGVRPAAGTGAGTGDFAGVWGEDVLTCGLGNAFGVPTRALPDDLGALLAQAPAGSRQLLVIDALQRPVQYEDADAYRKQLARLDARWFAPLQKALAGGRIKRLRLEASTAYATLAWESGRGEQWQLWRRPRPLAATAQALAREGDG